MNVLSRGRRALLPHFGHCTVPLSCSRIDRLIVTARLHLSQWYSYTGMAAPLTDSGADPLPWSDVWIVPFPGRLGNSVWTIPLLLNEFIGSE